MNRSTKDRINKLRRLAIYNTNVEESRSAALECLKLMGDPYKLEKTGEVDTRDLQYDIIYAHKNHMTSAEILKARAAQAIASKQEWLRSETKEMREGYERTIDQLREEIYHLEQTAKEANRYYRRVEKWNRELEETVRFYLMQRLIHCLRVYDSHRRSAVQRPELVAGSHHAVSLPTEPRRQGRRQSPRADTNRRAGDL